MHRACRAVSFYVDQFPFNDMAREQAAEYGIRICSSVAEAIAGVDGIAVIGEHGNYPRTPRGNFMYPAQALLRRDRPQLRIAIAGSCRC